MIVVLAADRIGIHVERTEVERFAQHRDRARRAEGVARIDVEKVAVQRRRQASGVIIPEQARRAGAGSCLAGNC